MELCERTFAQFFYIQTLCGFCNTHGTKEPTISLIYACIAPHAGDLIPETVKDKNIVALTRKSMVEMGAKLEALKPEVIVIVNPHGFHVHDAS